MKLTKAQREVLFATCVDAPLSSNQGFEMDETRRLAMRRAHAGHVDYCTCGALPRGNGGRAAHRAMHERRKDGHWRMTYSMWCDVQAGRIPMPEPRKDPQQSGPKP